MNAIEIMKYGQQPIHAAIDDFPESAWETPGACGVWSVKDIIAHLASYEQVLIDVFATFLGDGPTPYLDKFKEPGGLFNDAEVAARKEKTRGDVWGEFRHAHVKAMLLATRIPAATFRETGTLPWYGKDYSLDDFIVYAVYGHKREHGAQIAAFRDGLREEHE